MLILLAASAGASTAQAAGPPVLGAVWSSQVQTSSARVSARINANGFTTSAFVEYATRAEYEAKGFAGAKKTSANVGSGSSFLTIAFQALTGLSSSTEYRYRVTAANSGGPSVGAVQFFVTQPPGGGPLLPDGRGWEMVSPVDKNGGQVDPPGALAKGGTLQAASGGGAVTYGSAASFAGGAAAPSASQYLATRGSSGWATQNITAPLVSASKEGGVPFQLFSAGLERALIFNGDHCEGGGCGVENPPLPGTDAPPAYQDYYLRDTSSGSFEALMGTGDIAGLDIGPSQFDLRVAGASPDLAHVIISSCASLAPGAGEAPLGEGCDPAAQNLYRWSAGEEGLALINGGTPGAALAAQSGAVSADGSRIYFTQQGNLYLRAGGQTKQVDADAGSGGAFQTASADGSVALFTKAGHLWRYDDGVGQATDLSLGGGVKGVLGASADAAYVYYQDAAGLKLWHSGATTTVALDQASPAAEAADPGSYPPTSGAARVSPDGTKLVFASAASLTGFDNTDLNTGDPDSQVYLYDASAPSLTCVSCNPTNQRPVGSASIPGSIANGAEAGSTNSYKPRVLSANGKRVFFDSADALVLTDTNSSVTDTYQWEASGEGSCTAAAGCISLISSGRSAGGSTFIDASADGSSAFFLTDDSLVGADPDALDLYVARVGGGFAEPSPPIPCEGDACQILPPEPVDPTLTTLLSGRGNPKPHYENLNRFKQKKSKKKKQAKHGKKGQGGKGKQKHKRGGRR